MDNNVWLHRPTEPLPVLRRQAEAEPPPSKKNNVCCGPLRAVSLGGRCGHAHATDQFIHWLLIGHVLGLMEYDGDIDPDKPASRERGVWAVQATGIHCLRGL
jgi:hypothetical protein